jgi:asparagine synthase (glutamine-hydrolysing)
MCGILGAFSRSSRLSARAIARALDTIRHRGPDDEGFVLWRHPSLGAETFGGADTPDSLQLPMLPANDDTPIFAAFAHRRLAILDLTEAGHQPMSDESSRYWLVFNGEIYNYVELRTELEHLGDRFFSATDTEVLLIAWKRWGLSALSRLRGMFALAILDVEAHTITLARDPLGIKPLYYTESVDGLAFGSEIKALLMLPGVSRQTDPTELYRFMRFGATEVDEHTCFANVRQLLPGHVMEVHLDQLKTTHSAFWEHRLFAPSRDSMSELSARLSGLLDESIRLHLRSDVPVGSCFSGGLDSSLIVALARKQLAASHRWTGICFDNALGGLSDAPFASELGEILGLNVQIVTASAEQFSADVDNLVYHQDVPFRSTSIFAQYAVFRRARECGVTVMLDGQGADELFGGYSASIAARICEALWAGDLSGVYRLLASPSFPDARIRRRTMLAALGRIAPTGLTGILLSVIGEPLVLPEMDGSWFTERGVTPAAHPQGRGRHALREELRLQTRAWALPQLLRYEDRNSMAFGIEARVPFCTPEIAEFAASVPSERLILNSGVTKAVLREAARCVLPDVILERPKIGFLTDESSWIRRSAPSLREEVLGDRFATLAPLRTNAARAKVLAALDRNAPVSAEVWRILVLAIWARRFDVTFE